MNAQDLKGLLEASPFLPFRVHLSNGQSFEVKHPDFVALFRSHLLLLVPSPDERTIMDHAEYISLLHIARIEQLPVTAPV
jgi:hypothetical protein